MPAWGDRKTKVRPVCSAQVESSSNEAEDTLEHADIRPRSTGKLDSGASLAAPDDINGDADRSCPVKRFLHRQHISAPATPEGKLSPARTCSEEDGEARGTAMAQRLFQLRHNSSASALQTHMRSGGVGVASAGAQRKSQHRDSPWPSPAHRRRHVTSTRGQITERTQPMTRSSVEADSTDAALTPASPASSLTNVSTISIGSLLADELRALGDSEESEDDLRIGDDEDDERPCSDIDWLRLQETAYSDDVFSQLPPTQQQQQQQQNSSVVPALLVSSTAAVAGRRKITVLTSGGQFIATPRPLLDDFDDDVPCLEDIRQYNQCLTCGVNWANQEASLACLECGGYALERPCADCSGRCSSHRSRDISASHDRGVAVWSGVCPLKKPEPPTAPQMLDTCER